MSMLWAARALGTGEVHRLRDDPDAAWDLLDDPDPGDDVVHLNKEWHGVHWLLTGTAWDAGGPLGQVILGGEEFGEDGGYGPPRLLAPADVADLAAALRTLRRDELRSGFDPAALSAAGVYPDVWAEPNIVESLLPYVEQLRAFYGAAADRGAWVLQAIV
ncbi:MAG: DUF1877 family protein [Nocardioides sp.]